MLGVSTTVHLRVHSKCVPSFLVNGRRTKFSCSSLKANDRDTGESVSAQGSNEDDGAIHGNESNDVVASKHPVSDFQQLIATAFPVLIKRYRCEGSNSTIWIWLFVATSFFIVAVRVYVNFANKSSYSRRTSGSVADLIRRGQLKSYRRGTTICASERRSRAYQWKRPIMFLKEGDVIPPDVDPDTIRWNPVNHPFATTTSDIDEDLAQNNVYQKHEVPFRIQAETGDSVVKLHFLAVVAMRKNRTQKMSLVQSGKQSL